MSNIFQVEWIVTPKTPPQPRLSCSGCGRIQAFKSSGKIRLNANGRRLDAWAIYKCVACDNTWNKPIFERENVRNIDPSVLQALQTSDAVLVTALAFDITQLRRFSNQIEEFPDADVRKTVNSEATAPCFRLELTVRLALPVCLRLDRLLATEMALSRTRIRQLEATGCISIIPERKDALRRRVHDGMRIMLDLSAEAGAAEIMARAMCKKADKRL